jgi:hypothetical protein
MRHKSSPRAASSERGLAQRPHEARIAFLAELMGHVANADRGLGHDFFP